MKKKYLALGLTLLAIALGWFWLEHTTRPEQGTPVPSPAIAKETPVATVPTVKLPPAADQIGTTTPLTGVGTDPTLGEQPGATPTLTAGDILAEPDDDYVRVAKKLSALVRDAKAPMAEREEALAHTLNLSAGNEAEVLTPLVTDPNLPDSLTETILSEALNRPLDFQADLYLAALAVHKSPEMQTLIREHLVFLTGGEDLGSDPKAWVQAINNAKKDWQ